MDYLRDWPEPIVRVQSLSDSGAQTIPGRYIKPPSERPSGGTPAATGEDVSIPVIDLAMLDDDVGARDDGATVKAIADACRVWGFFQAVNHGVSPALMRRAREVWRGFFHLSMEEKQRYANSPKTYEGYGSRLGIERGAILDWGDYYFLHFLPLCLMSHHKWPAMPPTLRDTNDEYGVELTKLCRRLLKALSIGLGLQPNRLLQAFDEEGVCMRVNFYPKCPQPDLTLGLSAHSDPGGITVLLVDDHVTGLQVRRNDSWITVKPVPDAFIINVGDQIQVLSNATYRSVEHRVMVNAAAERLSMAFFYNPKSDIPIGPVAELVTAERPALYQPMTFDEYRLFIRKKGPRGKSQVESRRMA
ncbi:flavonol synthase/flavanone 3-hydroxylase-like isoform X2 [Canna indica]|uniref:Flavonol synthase/flavanone 3-hydroxylase-like isoform X2 n=1 Tax=Canna indica TaxID=4628 RepID=A0AAQ3K6E0_9LILI|nr:flavonol synthase/flavanone 3-hydroxylase-like isoform X2 [Canna indica]